MKEKEWKKEQKIPLLPVEFPEDSVMQKECRAIVEKAIPKRQSLWERIKEIYWGPGIRAIFYQSGSIWLIVACLYLGIGWLGQLYAKQPETQMIIVFLGFPVCFLVFAVLAWWLDAQNHMQELIGSLHYSQSYLSGLRMLYAGVIMILVNVTGAALFTDVSGKAFVSMVLVGSSSVFLFASVCVYACHKGAGGLFYAGLIAVWACVCVIARLAGTGVQTTLIKMIATLLVPTQGEILWDGIPVAKLGEKYRDLLGYLPQQFGYYKNNTPVQYLDYLAALKNMPKQTAKEKIEQLLELVGLSDVADKKMKKFSGGMIQRVGIAQAMLNDPKILILDEPTAGLDPKERARFRNILSTLSKDRIVILSTHIVSDIESNANQVILLKERKLYRMDTVSNICKTLDGKVYECVMEDRAFDAFQDTHLILSVRQEQEHMQVRYYSSKPEEGSRNCTPNLEDVFLVTYQEEPA